LVSVAQLKEEGVSDRRVMLRRGRRVGWWVEGRSARGRLFMKTWWPTEGLARAVARLVAGGSAVNRDAS
jgi:hypothetical protein